MKGTELNYSCGVALAFLLVTVLPTHALAQDCQMGDIVITGEDDGETKMWSGVLMDVDVQSVAFGDEVLAKIFKLTTLVEDRFTTVEAHPIQPNLNDQVDYHGLALDTQYDAEQGIQVELNDGTKMQCPVRLIVTNNNNRVPVFNSSAVEFVFNIESTWSTSVPLNWDPAYSIVLTDWDREVEEGSMSVKSSDPSLTAKIVKRARPVNAYHEYDVSLFVTKPVQSGTFTLTPFDGENSGGSINVTVVVEEKSLFAPRFRNLEYHVEVGEMPQDGDLLEVDNLEAFDPDEEMRDNRDKAFASTFTYGVKDAANHDFVQFKDNSNQLVFTAKVSGELGKTETLTLVATQDSTKETAECTLTVKFPVPPQLSFNSALYHVAVETWPEEDEIVPLGISVDPPFEGATIIYEFGATKPVPDTVVLVNGNEIQFMGELNITDLGGYQDNRNIVFDLIANVKDSVGLYGTAHTGVVITLPVPPEPVVTTTTEEPMTTEEPDNSTEITTEKVTTPTSCLCTTTPNNHSGSQRQGFGHFTAFLIANILIRVLWW